MGFFLPRPRVYTVAMKSIKPLLMAFVAAVLVTGFFWWLLWLRLLGPFGYSLPEGMQYQQHSYQLFVYGTLRNRWLRWVIIGQDVAVTADGLPGFQKQGLTVVANQAAVTSGLRLEVSARQLQRLDRYERLGQRYCRFKVSLLSGESAWVYQRMTEETAACQLN